MSRWLAIVVLLLAGSLAVQWWFGQSGTSPPDVETSVDSGDSGDSGVNQPAVGSRYPSFLPPEAVTTLAAIERGGPFPYDRDGSVFQNRERLLPERPRGYYREYTVETPGSRDRGARRIVTGGQPPEVYYYTDDHYRSFRRVEASQ